MSNHHTPDTSLPRFTCMKSQRPGELRACLSVLVRFALRLIICDQADISTELPVQRHLVSDLRRSPNERVRLLRVPLFPTCSPMKHAISYIL